MITLSEDNAIVTSMCVAGASLTTTNTVFTEGTHFWETELLSAPRGIYVGVWRPNLDPVGTYNRRESTDGWFISAEHGAVPGYNHSQPMNRQHASQPWPF
jgi:hypothetical protein